MSRESEVHVKLRHVFQIPVSLAFTFGPQVAHFGVFTESCMLESLLSRCGILSVGRTDFELNIKEAYRIIAISRLSVGASKRKEASARTRRIWGRPRPFSSQTPCLFTFVLHGSVRGSPTTNRAPGTD